MRQKGNRQERFYVARRSCCGCIAAIIADDDLLPNEDKGEMVRSCIEAGLTVDRLTLDQMTGILMAQRNCEHPVDDDFSGDIPFDEDDDDSDIPF